MREPGDTAHTAWITEDRDGSHSDDGVRHIPPWLAAAFRLHPEGCFCW
jgi:hypothetical protein